MKNKHHKQLKPGLKVMIFLDPLTEKLTEGTAVLRKKLDANPGDGLEIWNVEFSDEPGAIYIRTIKL